MVFHLKGSIICFFSGIWGVKYFVKVPRAHSFQLYFFVYSAQSVPFLWSDGKIRLQHYLQVSLDDSLNESSVFLLRVLDSYMIDTDFHGPNGPLMASNLCTVQVAESQFLYSYGYLLYNSEEFE